MSWYRCRSCSVRYSGAVGFCGASKNTIRIPRCRQSSPILAWELTLTVSVAPPMERFVVGVMPSRCTRARYIASNNSAFMRVRARNLLDMSST